MNIYENITKLIGKTPLVYLNSIKEKYQLQANLIAKLESLTRIFTFFMSHEKVRDQSPTEWGFAFSRGYSSSPPIACSAGSSAT